MKMHTPFIPAWMDDARLLPTDVRVLVHLWRRAGKKCICWPSAPSIARTCGLNRDTVWDSLARLEKTGFLTRRKHYRNANEYLLTIPPVSGNGGVIQPEPVSGKQGPIQPPFESAETERPVGGNGGVPVGGKEGPPSVPSEVSPSEGVCEEHTASTHTHLWPEAIPDQTAIKIAEALHLTESAVREQWTAFRRRKLGYRDQAPPTEAEVWDQFQGWLEGRQPKRNSRAYGKTADYSRAGDVLGWGAAAERFRPAAPTASAALPEPPGWRELAAANEELKWAAKDEWATMNPHYQKQMIELVKGTDAKT